MSVMTASALVDEDSARKHVKEDLDPNEMLMMTVGLSPRRDVMSQFLLRLARVARAYHDVTAHVLPLPVDNHRAPVHVVVEIGGVKNALTGAWNTRRALAFTATLFSQLADYSPQFLKAESQNSVADWIPMGHFVEAAGRHDGIIAPLESALILPFYAPDAQFEPDEEAASA